MYILHTVLQTFPKTQGEFALQSRASIADEHSNDLNV